MYVCCMYKGARECFFNLMEDLMRFTKEDLEPTLSRLQMQGFSHNLEFFLEKDAKNLRSLFRLNGLIESLCLRREFLQDYLMYLTNDSGEFKVSLEEMNLIDERVVLSADEFIKLGSHMWQKYLFEKEGEKIYQSILPTDKEIL